MIKYRIFQKKTKKKQNLLRNFRKGKVRRDSEYIFQTIPYPLKFTNMPQLHRFYGDLVLLEQNGVLSTEGCLYNHYKVYKHAQIFTFPTQRLITFHVENKSHEIEDWRIVSERIQYSPSKKVNELTSWIKTYVERYQALIEEFQQKLSPEKTKYLTEINQKSQRTREEALKTLPCFFFKSQLIDGQIRLTEVSYSEKYLKELGYSLDDFPSLVFQEGVPMLLSLDNLSTSSIAKMRLEKYLTVTPDGFESEDIPSSLIMKNGYIKKVLLRAKYYTCFENGVPGFVFMGILYAQQELSLNNPKLFENFAMNPGFVDNMVDREKEKADFLSKYYNVTPQQKYTDMPKVCKIKEIEVQSETR